MDPKQQRAGGSRDFSAILKVLPFVAIFTMQPRAGTPAKRKKRAARPQAQGSRHFSLILKFLCCFAAILSVIMILSSSVLHQVPEGHVGVYWRGRALLKIITNPGFHLKMPLVTHYEPVQVTPKIDQLRDIPCGTKGGVMINFEKIEVVSQLHKDYVYETLLNLGVRFDQRWMYYKIAREIEDFCSSHSLQQVYFDAFNQIGEKIKAVLQDDWTRFAPGIEVIRVRVAKPAIPDGMRRIFEQAVEEELKVLMAVEKQKLVEKEAETSKKMSIIEAKKNADVSNIRMEQKLMEFRSRQEIENQMHIAREVSELEAEFRCAIREAETNKLRTTPQFRVLKVLDVIDRAQDILEKVSNRWISNLH